MTGPPPVRKKGPVGKRKPESAVPLLRDVARALEDLGACDDEECKDARCLRVLPRVRAYLRWSNGA